MGAGGHVEVVFRPEWLVYVPDDLEYVSVAAEHVSGDIDFADYAHIRLAPFGKHHRNARLMNLPEHGKEVVPTFAGGCSSSLFIRHGIKDIRRTRHWEGHWNILPSDMALLEGRIMHVGGKAGIALHN